MRKISIKLGRYGWNAWMYAKGENLIIELDGIASVVEDVASGRGNLVKDLRIRLHQREEVSRNG